jgi:hypothetical protein
MGVCASRDNQGKTWPRRLPMSEKTSCPLRLDQPRCAFPLLQPALYIHPWSMVSLTHSLYTPHLAWPGLASHNRFPLPPSPISGRRARLRRSSISPACPWAVANQLHSPSPRWCRKETRYVSEPGLCAPLCCAGVFAAHHR